MFCSNCGKTIRPESDSCQHCGASLGEDRFYGNTYTSSQVRIPAEALNQAPAGGMIAYTRTNYMSYDNQPETDVYSGTTYRPLLTDEEDLQLKEDEEAAAAAAEEEARRAEEEAARAEESAEPEEADEFAVEESPEEPAGEPDYDDLVVEESEIIEDQPAKEEEPEDAQQEEESPAEDVPAATITFRPDGSIDPEEVPDLDKIPKPAISPRVLSYMEELDRIEKKRANGSNASLRMPSFLKGLRKKNEPADEELPEAEDIPSQTSDYEEAEYETPEGTEYAGEYAEEPQNEYAEETEYAEEDEYAEDGEYAVEESAGDGEYVEESGEYVADGETDDFDSYEDEYTGEEQPTRGLSIDFKGLLQNRILKISVAAVLIIAVLAVGIYWLNFVTAQRPPIVDITYNTYAKGIELLNANISEEYRDSLKNIYISNTSVANASFKEDMDELNALMPETPAENDQLFVTTLTIIQDAIQEAIKADANAMLNGTEAAQAAASELRWQAITNAVDKLTTATTTGELTALITDLESVVAPTATPSPTPTPSNYVTLTNGMMDDMDVMKMQNRLINLGYLTGNADGDFGNGTESAVKAFQRAIGMTADGIATPELQEALYAEDAPRVNATVETTATPSDPAAE